ncbi:MAG TPA: universal stress protein [Albitalea sp.]
MSFRSLLVLLDGEAPCAVRSHLAARMAAAHASHLIGLAPTGPLDFLPSLAGASHSIEEVDAARAGALDRASRWTERFEQVCRAEGAASFETVVREGEPLPIVLHEAHCADLTVISQADTASPSHRHDKRFVDHVLLHNARPTLVVPAAGRFDRLGQNVLVAWDDSPGCARATADALPMLRAAQRVHLRVWCRPGEPAEAAIRRRAQTVQRWLTQHGVTVDAALETSTLPIGEAILVLATRLGVDVIVMGTYGHAHWTERIIGSTTRTALARSTVPLLMSH